MRTLREQGGIPLYRQIADTLRAEVMASSHPGEAIATEAELEQRFSVSRITIRRALDEIVREGLLVRRRGSGTFVARPKIAEQLGILHSWTDGMRRQGLEPRTVDCEILQVVPPQWVVQALRLDPLEAQTVLRVQRLRYADNEPLCLMADHLRMRFVADLLEDDLRGESLYDTLETRCGLELARVEDTVSARGASVFEASLLGVSPGAPVLFVTRVTYLRDDEPLDAATVVSRADRYEYRVSGRALRPSRLHAVPRETEILGKGKEGA
jgi:DNA-binding GntR family transcriptional regulator